MKKHTKIIISILFTIMVFSAGVWIFAPWEAGALYALDSIRLIAARNELFMNYSDVESSGVIFPTYHIRSLDVESRVSRTSLSNVIIKVLPLSSLLARGLCCYIEFDGGNTELAAMDDLSHDRGRLRVTASPGSLHVTGAQIEGDVKAYGGIAYDFSQKNITNSTLTIRVPDKIDSMMQMAARQVGRYIEQAGSGEWRVKHDATAN
jgi:hypothetical protein